MVQKRDDLHIVNHLLTKNDHVRAIATTLQKPHATIARRLHELKEVNILDYEQSGKNKVFFLKKNLIARNHILQAELHKLTTLLQKHPALQIILEEVLKNTNKELIILFGSYAKGLEKKSSDIDLYIETEDKDVKKRVEQIHSKINVKIGLFNKESPLIKEIIKNHIILRGFEEFYEKK